MWVFDLIIGNVDRHNGNFLVKDGKVYAIDHGRSFGWDDYKYTHGRRDTFGQYINTTPNFISQRFYSDTFDRSIPQDIVSKLKEFTTKTNEQKILESLLAELIGKKHAEMVIKRILVIGAIVAKNGSIPIEHYKPIVIPQ